MSLVENDGWFKACEASSCVEVKPLENMIILRNSLSPDAQIQVTVDQWLNMLHSIRAGEWDVLVGR